MTPEQQSCLEWIRSRPTEIQELMKKFPPSCKVRAVVPLHVPSRLPRTPQRLLTDASQSATQPSLREPPRPPGTP